MATLLRGHLQKLVTAVIELRILFHTVGFYDQLLVDDGSLEAKEERERDRNSVEYWESAFVICGTVSNRLPDASESEQIAWIHMNAVTSILDAPLSSQQIDLGNNRSMYSVLVEFVEQAQGAFLQIEHVTSTNPDRSLAGRYAGTSDALLGFKRYLERFQ